MPITGSGASCTAHWLGIATMGFRYFGVYETGVCFALLAVNSVSALIDRTEERLYRLLHRLPSERKEAAE